MKPDDPLNEKRRFARNLHGAYIIGVVVISVIVVLAGYRSFRRIFSGFSRDFMSPFFSCAIKPCSPSPPKPDTSLCLRKF